MRGKHHASRAQREQWLAENYSLWKDHVPFLRDYRKSGYMDLEFLAYKMKDEGLYAKTTLAADAVSGIRRMIEKLLEQGNLTEKPHEH